MKITLAKSIIIDRNALFMILKNHFKEQGFDVANMTYECSRDVLNEITLHVSQEELKYEQNS